MLAFSGLLWHNRAMHGYIILDKPFGMGSTTAVSAVKRLLRPFFPTKNHKIGHGGTLDPLASGVLPIAIGEATKTVSYVLDGDKEYEFTVRWGQQTTTDDSEGDVTHKSAARPAPAAIQAALASFQGTIMQTPPAFSALKIDGARAYDLARAGEAPIMTPRAVEIHALRYCDSPDADHSRFHLVCGKGTYVRALARDLAIKLGTYGHVAALRRVRAGPFTADTVISLEKLAEYGHNGTVQQALMPVMTALDDIPALAVTEAEAQRLRHGQPLMNLAARGYASGTTLLVVCNNTPVALTTCDDFTLTALRVFNL